ncbi:MAG: hypothetical protein J1G06_04285 [Oscillospiraceae bacterium]|nr:hypothetical protein [Oscillospiraceae bacterium]
MKQKIIAALLAAAALAPAAAQAEEWIELSAWSYNEVSGFVSEGLLPDSMKGISNYKRAINRGEFCTLLYSVLKKSGIVTSESDEKVFADCENYPDVDHLARIIKSAVQYGSGSFRGSSMLYPEEDASRIWAAGVAGDMLITLGIYVDHVKIPEAMAQRMQKDFKDYDEIKDSMGVGIATGSGIMSDMDDGCFHGNDSMTIEQAVSVIYRMYKLIPRVVVFDNEYGETSRKIGAGLIEEITEDYYNIKSGADTVISLETDIYSKVLAADYNGSKLIFAVNFNNRTDVFDADSHELLYTIPYIVNEVNGEKGYAYTLSGRFMPCYTGIYGMDNIEFLKPEYSRAEIDAIAENGMETPTEEYREPDGFIYYADRNDGGHMYRVDSNGENNQLIVDSIDCTNIRYFNGRIYFNDNNNGSLHSVNTDGTGLIGITDCFACPDHSYRWAMYPYLYPEIKAGSKDIYGFYDLSNFDWGIDDWYLRNAYSLMFSDGSILYYTVDENALKRTGKQGAYSEDGRTIFRCTPDGRSIKLADFYIRDILSALNGDGRLYFQNEEELYTTGESPIYVNDNGELKCISGEYKAAGFGFGYNYETEEIDTSKIAFITQEEVLKGTYHLIDLATGEITEVELPGERPRSSEDRYYYDYLCNDEFRLWRNYGEEYKYDNDIYLEYNGQVKSIGNVNLLKLSGDVLYYYDESGYVYSLKYRSTAMGSLKSLNYKTGEIKLIAADLYADIYNNSDMLLFETMLGEVKRTKNGEAAVTVFPNKNVFRYGEVDRITLMPDFLGEKDCLYKIDMDGNITKLTDTDSQNALYVPNDGGYPIVIR